MVCPIKKLVLFLILTLAIGCTDLGDLVLVEYKVISGNIQLEQLDISYLSKEKLGKSTACLTRRSEYERDMWMGVCYDEAKKVITVYRSFPSRLNIEKKGISNDVMNSESFKDLKGLCKGVEKTLEARGVSYKKARPKYTPFEVVQKQFSFTR